MEQRILDLAAQEIGHASSILKGQRGKLEFEDVCDAIDSLKSAARRLHMFEELEDHHLQRLSR